MFTPQDFESMFGHFLTLCMKGLKLAEEITWNQTKKFHEYSISIFLSILFQTILPYATHLKPVVSFCTSYISDTPPPFFFKRGGGSKFLLPPLEGDGIWKLKKGVGSMVQGQVYLKGGGGWHFSHLIFFKI